MEMFKCMPFGDYVDLDADETYEHCKYRDFTTHGLWDYCIGKIGYAFMYVNYFNEGWDKNQCEILKQFYFWFAREEHDRRFNDTPENRLWFKKWIYRFESETENMC